MTYTIKLDGNDLAVIGEALEALPYRKVAKIIARVQEQISAADQVERDRVASLEPKES